MSTKLKLLSLLQQEFNSPDLVKVEDPRNDDKHFEITITSYKFENQSLIQRNRIVHKCLNPLFESGELHAITLNLKTPNE